MKIAFITLPNSEDHQGARVTPPLPLAYVAAFLEQQRHIVRVYDLALMHTLPLASVLAPLRAFRPNLVVIASTNAKLAAQVEEQLQGCAGQIMHLATSLRELAPGQAVAHALWRMHERPKPQDEQTVIFEALLALNDDLDSLPFPARHLLPLEQYALFTHAGDLQTTVLLAQYLTEYDIVVRQPAIVVAELQSIVREYGIRHFLFPYCPIQGHREWLHELLECLSNTNMDVAWEIVVPHEQLDAELLHAFRRAGCEALSFAFTAGDVLESRATRGTLTELINQSHAYGMRVRAHVQLEPLFSTVPTVVDISATLNLDDVEFSVRPARAVGQAAGLDEKLTLDDVTEMARSRYRSSRSRQFFIERFGPQVGPALWRVGRAGLLGRTWWGHATGSEDGALVY